MSIWQQIAGAGAGLFGSLANIGAGKRNYKRQVALMDKQQEYNRENMAAQYGYQLDMMQRMNEYNSPEAIVARYRKAGISPLAAFSSGGAQGLASASSPPSSSNPSPVGSTPDSLSNVSAGAINAMEALARVEAMKEQTRGQKIENDNKQTEFDKKFEYQDALTRLTTTEEVNERIETRLKALEERSREISNEIAEGTKGVTIDTAYRNYELLGRQLQRIDVQNDESRAHIGVMAATELMQYAQAEYTREYLSRKTDAETKQILLDVGFLSDTYETRYQQVNNDFAMSAMNLAIREFENQTKEIDWFRLNAKEFANVVFDLSDSINDWVKTLKKNPTMSDEEKKLKFGQLIIGALMALKK